MDYFLSIYLKFSLRTLRRVFPLVSILLSILAFFLPFFPRRPLFLCILFAFLAYRNEIPIQSESGGNTSASSISSRPCHVYARSNRDSANKIEYRREKKKNVVSRLPLTRIFYKLQ